MLVHSILSMIRFTLRIRQGHWIIMKHKTQSSKIDK